MGAIFKALNTFLGVIAIITCLAAVCVIAYSIIRPDLSRFGIGTAVAVDSSISDEHPENDDLTDPDEEPDEVLDQEAAAHEHEYRMEVYLQATCLGNGRLIYMCDCGDLYYEETESLGHQPRDWQIVTAPTATLEGVRVRICSECNETVAREIIPPTVPEDESPAASPTPPPPPHVHNYVASIEKQPTCTMAGTRKFSCSCGSFYLESISAVGHLAAAWATVTEATHDRAGVRQRICNVCKVLIDMQTVPRLTLAPGETPSPSPTPSVGPHVCTFTYHTSREPNCTEIGSSTGVCNICGDENIREISRDTTKHDYQNGTCIRCGHSQTTGSPSPSPSPSS